MLKKTLSIIAVLLLPIFANAADIKKFELDTPFVAPDIKFTDDKDIIHNLTDFKGKVVLLSFWATWCEPCVDEMPTLENLKKSMEGRDVEILPVSIDSGGANVVRKFYEGHNITSLPVYIDSKGKSFREFKLQALPTALVIDRRGRVVAKVLGEIDWNSKDTINYLMKVAGGGE